MSEWTPGRDGGGAGGVGPRTNHPLPPIQRPPTHQDQVRPQPVTTVEHFWQTSITFESYCTLQLYILGSAALLEMVQLLENVVTYTKTDISG